MVLLRTLVQRAAKITLREGKAALEMSKDGARHLLNGKRKPEFSEVETIILLHGIATINGAMDPLASHIEDTFPEDFNVRLVGYKTSWSYGKMEREVVAQLDNIYAKHSGGVILIGYSLGANFAVTHSRKELERTQRVIGIAPATNGARVSHLLPKLISPEVARRTRTDSREVGDFHPKLLPEEVKYFFIRAEEDLIVCDSRGKNGQYQNVSYLVLDNVGHWSVLKDPRCHDAVAMQLRDHLNGYDLGGDKAA